MKWVHHRLQQRSSSTSSIYQRVSLTLMYISQTSVKNPRIPSSFFPSCSSTNFMSCYYLSAQWTWPPQRLLTPRRNKSGHSPFIELVHGFEIPIRFCLALSNDMTHLRDHHSHPIVSPHHLLNHVQTRIGDHLDHMSILPTAHSNSAPLCARLHDARRSR